MNPLALLAAAPAVPYDKAGRYVAAAFIVLFAVVLGPSLRLAPG